ncbi:MAG: VWA domain-containing protein [Rhodovibrionaceae bacterium]
MSEREKAKPFLSVVSPETEDQARLLSQEARKVFSEESAARWLRARRKLVDAGYGQAVCDSYAGHSLACARIVGPEPAIELGDLVSVVAIKSGRKAAESLCVAAEQAARRLEDPQRFRSWLSLIQRFTALAPESLDSVLVRMDPLLSQLNLSRLEAWLLAGVRSAGSDAERRLQFFSLEDREAERWLQREAGEVIFADVEKRLKGFLTALWRLRVPVREPHKSAPEQSRRRTSFGGGLIRIPATYPGYRGAQAEEIFAAAMAHVGAHLVHSREKFEVGNLKPIQIALVSLIEDARVEQLAMREFPGLRRLWLPFHIVQAGGALTAPSLLARLSRCLIDPDFKEVNGWVHKARDRFFDLESRWEDPAISREIGNLLGNDLGQMRVQFNPRTYIVEPPYRDDNLGLWDFGDQDTPEMEEAELLFESIRIERQEENDTSEPDRERKEEDERDDVNVAAVSPEAYQEAGIPVARYPEYDYATGRERADWTTVVEYEAPRGEQHEIVEMLERHHDLVNRISKLIRAARIGRPQRLKRQAEGEGIDIEAAIEAMISRRVGEMPDEQVYTKYERRFRDLSVSVLLDISESTKDLVRNGTASVLDIEKEATALLAHAMAELGDPFAIAAFCSNKREDVHYLRIKDFGAPYDSGTQAKLAGLAGGLSTRMGAAIRHASADLRRQPTHRRLLLVITDGEPSDIDITDGRYLVEDARRAVQSLAQDGIDVFCVGLDSGGDSYLSRIFGRRNAVQIDRIERLPEKLPMLYLRLTA